VRSAFLFREESYPKAKGAQAKVAAFQRARETTGGLAGARNFAEWNVLRRRHRDEWTQSRLDRVVIPGRVERREPGIHLST
jgi:hypothetical protein